MSYLKNLPSEEEEVEEEYIPKPMKKKATKHNNLEDLIGLCDKEPTIILSAEEQAAERSLDHLKYMYRVVMGHTSHCSRAEMVRAMIDKLEGFW